jgi:hypothetical protein
MAVLLYCADFGWGASPMRLLWTSIIAAVLLLGAAAGGARADCAFVAFCFAQRDHCYWNCRALTEVVPWAKREAFLQRCFAGCDRQHDRCLRHAAPRCVSASH